MKTDDIDKLLQQYGEDRRQQLMIADRLRKAAARRRRMYTAASAAVVLAMLASLLFQQKPSHNNKHTILAQHYSTILPTESQTEPTPPVQTITHGKTRLFASSRDNTLDQNDTTPEEITLPITTDSTSPIAKETPTTVPRPQPAMERSLIAEVSQLPIPPANSKPETQQPDEKESRFRIMASIGAATMTSFRIGESDIEPSNSIIDGNFTPEGYGPNTQYSVLSPSNSLSAMVGVSYKIASGSQRRLDIGVAFSGYSHLGEIREYHAENPMGIDGTTTTSLVAGKTESYQTFSLFAGLPIILNMCPLGKYATGWNVSITPAHNIAATKPLGTYSANSYAINPWKLTLGVGLTLPRKFPHSISITANLLSTYTLLSIHEVGIEIGF